MIRGEIGELGDCVGHFEGDGFFRDSEIMVKGGFETQFLEMFLGFFDIFLLGLDFVGLLLDLLGELLPEGEDHFGLLLQGDLGEDEIGFVYFVGV